jgi:ribosomal protein S18 acetylase RimI-like enzyme
MSLWREAFHWDDARSGAFAARGDVARAAVLFDADGSLAAAGRMYYEDGAFWLEAVAVREDLRGQGFGDLLTRMMLDRAFGHAAREARLYAPEGCEGFFGRYGFQVRTRGGEGALMAVTAGEVRLGGRCG